MNDFENRLYDEIFERFKKWIASASYAMMKIRHKPDSDNYRGV